MADWVWHLCLASRFTAADQEVAATNGKLLLEESPDIYGAFYPVRGRGVREAGVAPENVFWFAVAVRDNMTFTPPDEMGSTTEITFEQFYGA